MHPILRNRDAFILYLLAWGALGLVMSSVLAMPDTVAWSTAIAFSIPMSLLYAFVTLSAWYVCRAFPLKTTSILLVLTSLILAALLSSALWIGLGFAWTSVISMFLQTSPQTPWYRESLPWLAGTGVVLFLLAAAVNYLFDAFEASRVAERSALELQVLARDAELKALRAQIEPHFLFNSLNSISALTAKNPALAREMTLRLADFFRLSMKYGALDFVTLEEELDIGRKFLEIEKVRFEGRLADHVSLEPAAGSCLIPPLVLQPLIENAVNHGIASLLKGGTIHINARCIGNSLVITIENPYDGPPGGKKKSGIGMENVRQRLQRLYGSDARLDVAAEPSSFAVTLQFPVRY
jgi:sensor histidine kinase YesM